MSQRIITATDALALAESGRPVTFLDVRSLPGSPSLRPEYETAHIPGAHFVELTTQLQSEPTGFSGNRPLPTREDLQVNLQRWGVRADSAVVVYSNGTHGASARAWFVLTWAGLNDVRYLDGGLPAWQAAGGPVSAEDPEEGGGTATVNEVGHLPVIDADGVQALLDSGSVVIDARKASKYRGDEVDDEGNRGHIPRAVSVPAGSLLAKDGTIRPAADLRERFAELGVPAAEAVGVYCGGGVAAALETLILTELGFDPRLFVGSFSAWASDPARPIAVTTS